jgi:peptidoglycan hydrolase CwlO-like protein
MESQSRYSIVERLADKKLALMDDKAKLGMEIQELEQAVANMTTGIETHKKATLENLQRDLAGRRREIANFRAKLAYKKKTKASNEKTIDAKIKEVDAALKSIQKISETAPTAKENV